MVPEQPEHVMSPTDIRGCEVASKQQQVWKDTGDKMRNLIPMFGLFALAVVHCALSASLESDEKMEKVHKDDGLTKLLEIDQMVFEAAQRAEAAQMNVTGEQQEDGRYLEADRDVAVEERAAVEVTTTVGGAAADVTSHESESSEDADGRQRREHHEDVTVISLVEVREDTVSVEDELE